MAAVQPVEPALSDKHVKSSDLEDLVSFLNFGSNVVLRLLRARLNDLLSQMLQGTLTIGGTTITVGTGVPAPALVGHIYIRTDGGAGTTLYVKEGINWVGK